MVTLRNNQFSPAYLIVAAGTEVTWMFADSPIPHDVSFDDGIGSAQLTSGTWSRTFTKPGTYRYHCFVHDGMSGTVAVH